MENLRPRVFGLIKMSFRIPKKGQLRFSETEKGPKEFSENGQKCPKNFEKNQVPLSRITDQIKIL